MMMKRQTLWTLLLVGALVALVGCGDDEVVTDKPTADPFDSEAPLTDLDALLDGSPDESKLPGEPKADGTFPAQFDLVALQSPVRNQASRGVCSIFSTIGLMEHLYIKEGTITDPDFSEQFLQWSVKAEVGDFKNTSGSNATSNIEALNRFGVVEERFDPYETSPWGTSDDERCTGEDRPTVCFTNGDPDETALDSRRWRLPRSRFVSRGRKNIKAFMFNNETAVVAGMTFFYQSWNHRRSQLPVNSDNWSEGFVLPPNEKDREISLENRAGHSILLVGWDDELEVALRDEKGEIVTDADGKPVMEKGFFLFKNSWGTSGFGIRNKFGAGYGWIAMSYIEEFASVVSSGVPKLEFDDEICDDNIDNNDDRRVDCDDPKCGASPSCQNQPVGDDFTSEPNLAIPDNDPNGVTDTITVNGQGFATAVKVDVAITHPFQGDLVVTLVAPDGRTAVLHERGGQATDDLRETFSPASMVGAALAGQWRLEVRDLAASDVGTLVRWRLRFETSDDVLVENCSDGQDNVGNGLVDCADPACAQDDVCLNVEPGTLTGDAQVGASIPDGDTNGIDSTIDIAGAGAISEVRLTVDITHPFIGDLVVTLIHPDGSRSIVHDRSGSDRDDIVEEFVVTDFNGKGGAGPWKLNVSDRSSRDSGTLNAWSLEVDVR